MKIFQTNHKTRNYDGIEIPVGSQELDLDLSTLKGQCYIRIDSTAKDEGTCCLGGGIKMKFFPKGKRIPRVLNFMDAPFQGNVGSYKALKPALEYLKEYFPQLNFYYDDGVMD